MPLQRLIPIFLIDDNGQLVKTRKFKKRKYIGDPIVALRLFNDLGADEVTILYIGDGSSRPSSLPLSLLEDLSGEALMPLSYGGGLQNSQDALDIISLGFEKVIYSASRLTDGTDIKAVVNLLGSQSVSICVNYEESSFFGRVVRCHKSKKKLGKIVDVTKLAGIAGAGEIILQSISREGEFTGLDLNVVKEVSSSFKGPIVVSGGLRDLSELENDIAKNISGFAAGSFFVFSGSRRGVLISYPDDIERNI
tara:strand:+ start:115 stop:867 length:753 start_codon:yes stop_codon:yes gene_type:complete